MTESESNPITAYYDELAPRYDADRFGNSYGRFIDRLERRILTRLLADLPPGATVVDLACGTGRLLEYATAGVDASPAMIRVAQEKYPQKSLSVAEGAALPFADASVDAIYAFHLFMHLNHATLQPILEECRRVLRPHGRLIFDIPSRRRRELSRTRPTGWHGAFSLRTQDVRAFPGLSLHRRYGILLLPIHRFPAALRPLLSPLDYALSNSFLREYSSYFILEMRKS